MENENNYDVAIDHLEAGDGGSVISCGKVLRPNESLELALPPDGASAKIFCETKRDERIKKLTAAHSTFGSELIFEFFPFPFINNLQQDYRYIITTTSPLSLLN